MATLWGGQLSGSGTTHWGVAGLGVPGASIPATGTHGPAAAYDFLTLPAQNAVEAQWLMQTYPSAGAFDMGEDTGFALTGAPDGTYTFTGILKFDGVSQGLKTHTITIGAASGNQTLTATLFENQNSFGSHAISLSGGAQTLTATLFANTSTFGSHSLALTAPTASSVWSYPVEGGYTAADLLRIIAAAVAGKVSISGNIVTFTGLDGSTFRVVGTVDGSGNRTSVTHDGSNS